MKLAVNFSAKQNIETDVSEQFKRKQPEGQKHFSVTSQMDQNTIMWLVVRPMSLASQVVVKSLLDQVLLVVNTLWDLVKSSYIFA